MIIGFIIICVIIALIIAGVQESNKQKQNNRKVSKYAPTSKGEAVRHISGLPVAESTDLYLYNSCDKVIFSNVDHEFTISKSKIRSIDYSIVDGVRHDLFAWKLSIFYETDGNLKSVMIRGTSNLEKIKKEIEVGCNLSSNSIEL